MKNIPYIAYLPLIILSMIAFKLLDRIEVIGYAFKLILTIFVPFIWAFVIAYLANPILKKIEKRTGWGRGISIFVVYVIIISVIALFLVLAIPSLIKSITDITKNMPNYVSTVEKWLENQYDHLDRIGALRSLENMDLSFLESVTQKGTDNFNSLLSRILNGVVGVTSSFLKFFIGLVISIYMLKDKETFKKGFKRFCYALFRSEKADEIMAFMRSSDQVFSKYIIGKMIDSLIIGVLCFIGLLLIGAPYALLMAIVVGVTNMIPYFGPLIGAIPAIIITLFTNPLQALWVAVFILVLQQLDGYIIGPFILGDSVGMSPFWIILAILIGGGLFGVLGMLVGVPVMAVIRNALNQFVSEKLEKKGISEDRYT